jgi:hypothetical protein
MFLNLMVRCQGVHQFLLYKAIYAVLLHIQLKKTVLSKCFVQRLIYSLITDHQGPKNAGFVVCSLNILLRICDSLSLFVGLY